MANLVQRYANKTKNAMASIIAAPKVLFENRRAAQANADADSIKHARAYDNAPDFDEGDPTDAFKARSVAKDAKARIVQRAKAMKKNGPKPK